MNKYNFFHLCDIYFCSVCVVITSMLGGILGLVAFLAGTWEHFRLPFRTLALLLTGAIALALSGGSTIPFRREKIEYRSEAWRNSEYPWRFAMIITIHGTNRRLEGSIRGTPNNFSNSWDVSRSIASFVVGMSALRDLPLEKVTRRSLGRRFLLPWKLSLRLKSLKKF